MSGAVTVAAAPTRTGFASDTYGGVRPWFAAERKLVEAPSSSTTPRAASSAATAAAAAVPGGAASVGWIRGFVPAARPTSPNWLVPNVLDTVRSPVGRKS